MKRFTGIALLFFLVTAVGQSQSFKFAHINSDELLQALPEYDTASAHLEKYRQELINYLDVMQVELNNKSEAYNKDSKNLTDLVRQAKEQELIDLNRKIQEYQQNAQEQYQNKQAELFQPIYQKVDKAIKDVGKENGFIYVFDVSKGSILYFDTTKSTDIMALAKAKLGLK